MSNKYCNSLTSYSRRSSLEVAIGDIPLGGKNPIRVQSMTTVDTMDTLGSVEQSIRMIEAGSEYVRLTAPSNREAENLANIKQELKNRGYNIPLIADIHFTPNAAEIAARIVEKVRINPGNYIDRKKFQTFEYTDDQYAQEVSRIRERFLPLIKICKEYGTAMRIGTNHGSLSDRIMSRYGDTALGMVESALEFLRICEDEQYYQVVLSMKASNTLVMVEAYRLLVNKLDVEGLKAYPLHLGVTEAGEGEDGRIKSAVGIGALLEDGLGDTVRVSLTEEPEFEIPVALTLVERYSQRIHDEAIPPINNYLVNPFKFSRRKSMAIENIGGGHVPIVLADFSLEEGFTVDAFKLIGHHYLPEQDKWVATDLAADYVYFASKKPLENLPGNLGQLFDFDFWQKMSPSSNQYPIFNCKNFQVLSVTNFLLVNTATDTLPTGIAETTVLVLQTSSHSALASIRSFINQLLENSINCPLIIKRNYTDLSYEQVQLFAATDVGGLLLDGLGDGIMISISDLKQANQIAFGTLQAARTRMTKTEYISCPSCGRTLFDLQKTTAMIRSRTDHLKGVKIGIMGCIVNGPGEMADADYGYVGSGPGKITLYKGQEVVKKGLPPKEAVNELINLIKQYGDWVEPELDYQEV